MFTLVLADFADAVLKGMILRNALHGYFIVRPLLPAAVTGVSPRGLIDGRVLGGSRRITERRFFRNGLSIRDAGMPASGARTTSRRDLRPQFRKYAS